MGSKVSAYWRSESVQPVEGEESGGLENEPTCDPKSVNGHTNDSGDEDTQQDQDGGNLDGRNDNEDVPAGHSSTKDLEHEECVNGGGDEKGHDEKKEPEAHHQNGSNGVGEESCNEALENGTNGQDTNQIPIILLNDIFTEENASQLIDSRNPAEQAKITYASVARNANKVLIGQRQSQLTLESRKREHSADSDRSTPHYQHGYLNDLSMANRSKKAKSSETDSVSSSRSDRASTEIEQITPKAAKSRKRRAKPAKKYLS